MQGFCKSACFTCPTAGSHSVATLCAELSTRVHVHLPSSGACPSPYPDFAAVSYPAAEPRVRGQRRPQHGLAASPAADAALDGRCDGVDLFFFFL